MPDADHRDIPGYGNRHKIEAQLIVALLHGQGVTVTARQVWWWAERGKIGRHGRNSSGALLYDWAEVETYVDSRATLKNRAA